jgi:hypothetical protein
MTRRAPGVRGVWALHLFRKELERLLGLHVQRQPHLRLLLQVFYVALDFRKLAASQVQRSCVGVVRKGCASDGRCGDQVRVAAGQKARPDAASTLLKGKRKTDIQREGKHGLAHSLGE